jgi:ArsR family transcriptional regulator
MEGYQELGKLYRILSHPVRLRILEILSDCEACVCHLTTVLQQRQPYVSQQLAILREADLVAERRDGTLVYYRLRDPGVADMIALGKRWVEQETGGEVKFPPLPTGLVADCPCPHCHRS